MAFTIAEFIEVRPVVYHLTARLNLPRIRRSRTLHSTAQTLTSIDRVDLLSMRRRRSMEFCVDDEWIQIRDQAPLHAGNIGFELGWCLEDFIEELNGRVFFWPGTHSGPIAYGMRHFDRYQHEEPVVLRVPLDLLLEENAGVDPGFCKFNSGSPRCSSGRRSPRGSRTFVTSSDAPFSRTQVVEVTFRDSVILPECVEFAGSYAGPWQRLF